MKYRIILKVNKYFLRAELNTEIGLRYLESIAEDHKVNMTFDFIAYEVKVSSGLLNNDVINHYNLFNTIGLMMDSNMDEDSIMRIIKKSIEQNK